jgi:protein-disulfide isomerase
LLRDNGGQIQVLYRHWPLEQHRGARRAAGVALCAAREGRFEAVHARLMSSTSWLEDPGNGFAGILRDAGVADTASFWQCVRSDSTKSVIDADIAQGRRVGGQGTPTFVINSVFYQQFPDSATIARLLDGGRK